MSKHILLALGLLLASLSGSAAQNTTCSNRSAGDSSNACANTRFVGTALAPYVQGPASSVVGNIAWWNNATGTLLGAAPAYQAANPANASIYSQIANIANGYTTIYNGLQFSQGTPILAAEQFGSNTVGVQQALVGTLDIASGDTAGNAGYATIGYARTQSATTGAVGIGGVCKLNVASGNCWAENISVGNRSNLSVNGFDIGAMYGSEINVTVDLKAGAVEPSYSNLFGLYLIGSGTGITNKGSGISVDRLSITTGSKWLQAFESRAGAAVDALSVGPSAAAGTSLDSQFVTYRGVGSGGGAVTAQTKMDFNGNMLVRSALNAGVVLGDSVSNQITTIPTGTGAKVQFNALSGGSAGVIVNSTTGALSAASGTNGQLFLGVTAAAPAFATMSGDATITNAGVISIGATKITSAMLNADVFSTAHSWGGQQTFTAPILGTPASGTVTNLTGTASININGTVGATTPAAGVFTSLATSIPVTYTSLTPTIAVTDTNVIFNPAAGATVTMPSAATFPGRILNFKVIAAQTVSSAASNIVPVGSATPGTSIFGGASGKWAMLVSDGTNWIEMFSN